MAKTLAAIANFLRTFARRGSAAPSATGPISIRLAALSWSLVVTTGLAAALALSVFLFGTRLQTEDEWVHRTLLLRNDIAQLLILVQRAETSQRGYLLTGRDTYLVLYDEAVAALPAALDEITTLSADSPARLQAISRLRQLIADKIADLVSTISERKAGNADDALKIVNGDRGRQLMGEIRQLLAAMAAEEDRLLTQRQADAATTAMLLQLGAAIALLLICVIGGLVGFFTQRSFSALAAAHDQLSAANLELLDQVSKRVQVEAQLRQSQKMEAIGQLTGGIAHDFNNMLAVIMGSLALMDRRIKRSDFGIERFITSAERAVERAASLTRRLLAFARQQPLDPEAVDANQMITSMSSLLRSTLGEHIRIETVSAADLWTTLADAHHLESAILNLAINARDAMPDGGKLTIETANVCLDEAYCQQHTEVEPGQFVQIAVSDTGTGMPPEIAARAFEPFFTTKPDGKGSGLGLSQVYGFIKQSGGHIKIYSELGAGTTVKIYLPRLVEAIKQRDCSPPVPPRTGDASEVILVVEDDALTRRLSVESLRELGYTVLESADAAGALALVDGMQRIKLLFTDVVMPDVNGKRLADEARRRQPGLKVLFTTGYTRNAVLHGGVLEPGVNLLSKPFTLEQLAATVRAALDR